MVLAAPPLASPPVAFFGPIGFWEFVAIAAVGLLLFGKNLPEVGRQLGRTIVEFKRGLNQLKRQVTDDPALREARTALNDFRRELETPTAMLRDLRDPVRMLEDLTQPDRSTPGPEAERVPAPHRSFLDQGQ
ncbi:MAG TPA: twin-arginine translocase TatA/TatE family subunit [Planctomycetota bacterium]|nr:twin-arginine translocase TatA/TatE family subunit [Planctomycetota bacterium]